MLVNGWLVSWDYADIVRFWEPNGVPEGAPWFAPAPIEHVTVDGSQVWLFLKGRPFKLILEGRYT
jgi:hypothetical protein